MQKRFLSTLLILCMVFGMVPLEVFAAEPDALAEPKVTALTVSYDGGEPVDLLGNQPTVSLPAGSKPIFTVTFDSTDILNQVFVTSTKDGETKYLEAKRQGAQYITDGYFDPSDANYIPGTIAVTYSKKTVKVDKSGNVGGTDLNTLKTQLSSQGISCRNETTTSDGTVTAQIVLSDMFDAMGDVYFDAAVSEFTAGAGIDKNELNKWLGVYQNLSELSSYDLQGVDGKQYTLYLSDKDFGDTDTYLVLVKDITSNKYTRVLLQKAANMANLGDISGAMDAAKLTSGKLLEYRAISKDTAALREEIAAHPTMTEQQKSDANEKIAALDRDRKLFLVGITAVSALTNPVGTPLVISALVAGYSSIADYFWDYRVGLIQGCEPIEDVFFDGNGHDGSWIPITNVYIEENGNTINKSGKYYLAENLGTEGLNIGTPDANNPPVDVTLCFHGETGWAPQVYGGSTLHICDCTYEELEDGTVTGGGTIGSIGIREKCKLIVDSGIISNSSGSYAIYNRGGEVIIDGGTIGNTRACAVYNENNGRVTLNGGTIAEGICSKDGGEIVINGGAVTGNADVHQIGDGSSYWVGVWTDNGRIIMNNGQITSMASENGEITINNGKIGYISRYTGLKNGSGTVTVKGGEIEGVQNINGTITVSGGTIACYTAGIINGTGGTVNITGGTISDTNVQGYGISNQGTLNISAGSISGYRNGIKNDNGTVTITGGTVGGIESGGSNSVVKINNGTFNGHVENDGEGDIIISGGTFQSDSWCICNRSSGMVTLLINDDSMIKVDCKDSAFFNMKDASKIPLVEADEGYTSGGVYYSSSDAKGVKMTIQEAANIDFGQSYVRLISDIAASNPSDCEHTYTAVVTAPTCTERGYTTHTCSKCGNSYKDSYINALGHSYGEWVVVKAATSATSGTRERTCSVCQHKETSTIPATGGSGGGTTGGSSSGSVSTGGNSSTSTPTTPPVTTNTTSQGGTRTTETTVTPTATTKDDTATITVNSTTGNEIVKQAEKNKSDNVVIAPEIKGDVSKTEVTIPASIVGQIGSRTSASLTVSTPVAGVTIPNTTLNSLSKEGGNVKVTAERTGNTVELSVKTGSKTVDNIPGGVTLTVPVSDTTPGTVAMLVHEDGTREVVRKSVANNEIVTIPLDGSAKLEIMDNSKQFSDVPPDSWAANAITFVSAHELFNGTGSGKFNPHLPMNRGMLAVVLHNLEGNPDQAISDTFSDVSSDIWYAEGIAWAMAQRIVNGYGEGRFGPNDNITREQLVTILWRYSGSPMATNKELHFNDADKISSYAMEAVYWAVENGIINGYGNGQLGPQGLETRAQVAQMLKNYLEN